MNVTLTDLNLTIPAHSCVNLLSKHYYYTLDQLLKSAMSGSLFKKRNKIWLRNGELKKYIESIKLDEKTILKKPTKSNNILETNAYSELDDFDSDDEYVNELLEEG